jgi:oxygen-independent coproporphyrinogen-3 oxidase
MGDGLSAVQRALASPLSSVSADVILGTPVGDPLESVDAIAATGVPHISVYELTIEERTPLGKRVARGELSPRSADELADLYTATRERLLAAGYEHYEISSFARPGHRAIHNSAYWRLGEFLGVGNGAASFRIRADGAGVRWTNPRSVTRYLAGDPPEVEDLTADDLARDRIWLGMRTSDGVARSDFEGRAGLLADLVTEGLALEDESRIRPTLRGFLLSDSVARRAVGG